MSASDDESPPPAKKLCVKAPAVPEAPPDAAAEYARRDAAVEAARRKLARCDERQAFFRAQWHGAQKDGTPDEEAEALEVRWIAAYTDQGKAQKAYEAALAAFRTAPLGPVPEYGPDTPAGRHSPPPGVAYPGPSTTGGWTNPHVSLFQEAVKHGVKSRHLRILKPKHPAGGRFHIVENPKRDGDGGRGTVNDIWALETDHPERLKERAARWGSNITDPLHIVMNSTGKYYAGYALCTLHDGPYLPTDQLRTHISIPLALVSPFMHSVAAHGTIEER
jgi:hypothetical protein